MIIVTSSFSKSSVFNFCLPRFKRKAGFFKFLGLKSVSESLHFRDRLVWTVGLAAQKQSCVLFGVVSTAPKVHSSLTIILHFQCNVKRTCDEIHTCTTCIYSHCLFQHLEPGGSKGSQDVRVFHCPSGRGNVHRLHNGQPVDYNHITVSSLSN